MPQMTTNEVGNVFDAAIDATRLEVIHRCADLIEQADTSEALGTFDPNDTAPSVWRDGYRQAQNDFAAMLRAAAQEKTS